MDLADALKENNTLTDLNLSANKISDEGAMVLAEALKENNTLSCINLGFNNIGDEFEKVLKNLPRVKSGQLTLDI